jgi:transposase
LYKERSEKKRKEYLEKIADIPGDSIVYVDESGINEYLYREYCYARRGENVIGEVSGKKFKRINIIAGYINKTTIAECVYEGTTDGDFILAWVEQFLIRELKVGQTVVWDNASFHKNQKIEKLIKDAGCNLIFLPPYSPDLNPIEHFWANLKKYIRQVTATYDTLQDAIDSYFRSDNCRYTLKAA